MKISVIAPVKDEAPWIGYSILAAAPFVDEFLYGVDSRSHDGTLEILENVAATKLSSDKVRFFTGEPVWDFDPMNVGAYNAAFNELIHRATGDVIWFLHPDMIVTQGAKLKEGPLAWWTTITSFAGDFSTIITKGRATRWKNIHAKKFGLHYFGGYGSVNEDFYHSDITGNAYEHYGEEFFNYPYEIADSGIAINHYCELKSYRRRFEKMKLCLKTRHPDYEDRVIESMAAHHPRVVLEPSSNRFGDFEFTQSSEGIPEVITTYQDEFELMQKEAVHG